MIDKIRNYGDIAHINVWDTGGSYTHSSSEIACGAQVAADEFTVFAHRYNDDDVLRLFQKDVRLSTENEVPICQICQERFVGEFNGQLDRYNER